MNASIRYHKNPSLWKSFHNDSRKFLQKSWNKFQCFKVLLTWTNANCVGLRICYPGNSVSYHKNPAPTSLRPCEISRPSKKVSTCSLVLAWNDCLSLVFPLDFILNLCFPCFPYFPCFLSMLCPACSISIPDITCDHS